MQQTRERIYRAALALFERKGLDETTVAEIAEAADVGKGTFFTYYATKESVFVEVSADLVDRMTTRLEEASARGASFEARVAAYFAPAIEWHASHPVLSRAMLAAFVRDAAYVSADRPLQQRLYERLGHLLAEAQARGDVSAGIAVESAVTALSGTYFGSLGAWHAAGAHTPLQADFERSIAIVLRGLRP